MPDLEGSRDIPSAKLAILSTGNLKNFAALSVSSPSKAIAAEPKVTVLTAQRSPVFGVLITLKVLPVKGVKVIVKVVVKLLPVENNCHCLDLF